MNNGKITVGIGDDNKGEAWTPAADEKSEQVETEAEQAKQWADLAIPPITEEEHEKTELEAISDYINELLREKKKCQRRIIEINAELLLYRDFCKDILCDIKEGGIEE